jgi:hypothetical protein
MLGWRRHPLSLDEMAVGRHHSGGSHHKDVCHDLRQQPLWATGRRYELPRSAAREGDFCLKFLKIERIRRVVRHTAIYTVNESRSDGSKLMPGIMCGMLGASAFSPPEPCNVPLFMNMG